MITIIIIIMIMIIVIIIYSNEWIRGGFTKSHIMNYMDYLHRQKKSNKSANCKIFKKYANSVIKLNCSM